MDDQQLLALELAIERAPDEPANYLLRGEYWLTRQRYDQAALDFEKVRELVKSRLQSSAWGYIDQSYHDRATQSLRLIAPFLQRA